MKILVIGATKGIGLACVKAALAHDLSVRAMARRIERLDLDHPALEPLGGDATDPDDVARALDGVEAVAFTLGMPVNTDTLLRPVTLFSRATEVLIEAMRATGVRRLVAVTGFGSGDSRSAMSALERLGHGAILGRIYDDKTRQEALIRESGLDWTIARPVILTNGKATGTYKVLVAPEEWRNGLIARGDVADFVVRSIVEGTYIHAIPVLSR